MTGEELTQWVAARKKVLGDLLIISQQQFDAIDSGRMNELMSLLADKQKPLARLAEVSAAITTAISDDPDARHWNTPQDRDRCRQENGQCERMLANLMDLESKCEEKLAESRDDLRTQLQQMQNTREAVSGYSQADSRSLSGGRLDLSSQ